MAKLYSFRIASLINSLKKKCIHEEKTKQKEMPAKQNLVRNSRSQDGQHAGQLDHPTKNVRGQVSTENLLLSCKMPQDITRRQLPNKSPSKNKN